MTSLRREPAADSCPGVFDPHPAADGAVARIRLVGGRLRPDQLQVLASLAAEHGDGHIDLTGRGNLQLRGIGDVDIAAQAIAAVGLVPSSTHERVRNIGVSALTGRVGGVADLWPLADELDRSLRADPGLAGLSARFLFGLDDGHGDVARRRPDVCAVVRAVRTASTGLKVSTDPTASTDRTGVVAADLLIDGDVAGTVADLAQVPEAMLAVARDLTRIDPAAWRVADLASAARAELLARCTGRLDSGPDSARVPAPTSDPVPTVGWLDQDDDRVLLGSVVELGRLPARLAEFVAAVGAPVIITPDREILICDLDQAVAETVVRVLAPMGLIFDAASPWVSVSSCVGAPGCAKSATPVRDDLVERVANGGSVVEREHWVGCARGCGSPAGDHLRVRPGDDGYETERR